MTLRMGNRTDAAATVSEPAWFADTALLVMTYSKNEKYVSAVRKNLDLFWPVRPSTYYVSDDKLEGRDVIIFRQETFVGLLQKALAALKEQMAQCRYVYVLLEDLCPLAAIDSDRMMRLERHMRDNDAKYYYIPWADSCTLYSRECDARDGEIGGFEELDIQRLETTCPFYNSMVVTFWELEYLEWIIEQKLEAGVSDPWAFEERVPGDDTPHYFIDGRWPTVSNGFLFQGELNRCAVITRGFPPSPVRKMLSREIFGPIGPALVSLAQYVPRRLA